MSGSLIAVSGGMDSVTLLALAISKNEKVHVVHFQYGSKHNEQEGVAFNSVFKHYYNKLSSVDFIDLEPLFTAIGVGGNLMRRGDSIPEGHYQEENMRLTVVPGRNTIFASIMLAIAQQRGLNKIYLGIHSGDHIIYPDCRPDWFRGIGATVKAASEGKVEVWAPFLMSNKTGIIELGLEIHVPYHLTRTCYTDNPIACGRCGSCQERLEAFKNNGIEDPIEYQTRELLPKSV